MAGDVKRPCRKCGRPLWIVPHAAGTGPVPLDVDSAAYVVCDDGAGGSVCGPVRDFLLMLGRLPAEGLADAVSQLADIRGVYASHFDVCRGTATSPHRALCGRDFDGAHNALADVRACVRVYAELKKIDGGQRTNTRTSAGETIRA